MFVADLRGRGLGREVTRLVVAWAFDVLGVHRLQLEVPVDNHPAISCYLACGFKAEPPAVPPNAWKDFILMALLQSEHSSPVTAVGTADPSSRARGAVGISKRADP